MDVLSRGTNHITIEQWIHDLMASPLDKLEKKGLSYFPFTTIRLQHFPTAGVKTQPTNPPISMEEKDKKQTEKKVDILDSKNVVQGSSIQGNNVHIGDVHYYSTPPGKEPAAGNGDLEEIRKLISRGRVEKAIEALMAIAEEKGEEAADEIRMLSNQWQQLNKQERMGILSYNEATVSRNRITHSLLRAVSDWGKE